jgi:hypothetical protein
MKPSGYNRRQMIATLGAALGHACISSPVMSLPAILPGKLNPGLHYATVISVKLTEGQGSLIASLRLLSLSRDVLMRTELGTNTMTKSGKRSMGDE